MRLPLVKPLLFCALLLAGLTPAPARAALPPAPRPATAVAPAAWGPAPPPALLADGWGWKSTYRQLESCLSSRTGLIRVAMIGMFIALFIIIFNNKWK